MASGEVRLFLEHAGAVGLAVCLATLLDGAAPQSGIFGIGAGSEEFLLSSLIQVRDAARSGRFGHASATRRWQSDRGIGKNIRSSDSFKF